MVPAAIRRGVRHSISDSAFIGATVRRRLSVILSSHATATPGHRFTSIISSLPSVETSRVRLLTDDVIREAGESAAYRHVLDCWNQSSGDLLFRLLYTDIKTYLVELLMKQDNMSMAASIESRVPFLDHKLVEFATSIPRQLQLHRLSGKHDPEKGRSGSPSPLDSLSPKLGFPTPWSAWLAGHNWTPSKRHSSNLEALTADYFKR